MGTFPFLIELVIFSTPSVRTTQMGDEFTSGFRPSNGMDYARSVAATPGRGMTAFGMPFAGPQWNLVTFQATTKKLPGRNNSTAGMGSYPALKKVVNREFNTRSRTVRFRSADFGEDEVPRGTG